MSSINPTNTNYVHFPLIAPSTISPTQPQPQDTQPISQISMAGFAQIHIATSIEKTTLEGTLEIKNQCAYWKNILPILQNQYSDTFTEERVNAMSKFLEDGIAFADIKDPQQLKHQVLDRLEKNGCVYIPSEYRTQTGTHFCWIKLQKGTDNSIVACILNKGNGIEFHQHTETKGKKEKVDFRSPPIIITRETLLGPIGDNFFARISPPQSGENNKQAADVYGLLELLGGDHCPQCFDGRYSVGTLRTGTSVATHVHSVGMYDALINADPSITREELHKINFFLKQASLVQGYEQYKSELTTNPTAQLLFKKAVTQHQIRCLKMSQSLLPEQVQVANAICTNIVEHIGQISMEAPGQSLPSHIETISPTGKPISLPSITSKGSLTPTAQYTSVRKTGKTHIKPPTNISAKDLPNLLQQAHTSVLRKEEEGDNPIEIFEELYVFIKTLPLSRAVQPGTELLIWDSLTTKEAETCIEQLNNLTLRAYECCQKIDTAYGINQNHCLEISARSYDIGAQLALKFPQTHLPSYGCCFTIPEKKFFHDAQTEAMLEQIEKNFKERNAGKNLLFSRSLHGNATPLYIAGLHPLGYAKNFVKQWKSSETKNLLFGFGDDSYTFTDPQSKLLPHMYYQLQQMAYLNQPIESSETLDTIINKVKNNENPYTRTTACYFDKNGRLAYYSEYILFPNKSESNLDSENQILLASIKPDPTSASSLGVQERLRIIENNETTAALNILLWANDNITELKDPYVQKKVEQCLFGYKGLSRELKENPNLILPIIQKFLNQATQSYNKPADIKTLIWITKIADKLSSYIEENTDIPSMEWIDTKKLLTECFNKTSNIGVRQMIARRLMAHFKYDTPTEEDYATIIACQFAGAFKENVSDYCADAFEAQECFTKYSVEIAEYMKKHPETVANRIADLWIPDKEINKSWSLDNNGVELTNGTYTFNTTTWNIFINKQSFVPLSELIRSSALYKESLGTVECKAGLIENGYLMLPEVDARLVIEQSQGPSKELLLQHVEKRVLPEEEVWYRYGDITAIPPLALPPYLLNTTQYAFWFACDPHSGIVVTDKKTGKALFKHDGTKLHILDATGKQTGRTLRSIQDEKPDTLLYSWRDFFQGVASKDHLAFEVARTGILESIHLTQLGLVFNRVEENSTVRWKCSHPFADFYLESPQKKDCFTTFKGYFTLVKNTGERKIIVPAHPLTKNTDNIAIQENVQYDTDHLLADTPPYFEYSIQLGKTRLKAKTPEGSLYASLVCRNEKDYENAVGYLNQSKKTGKNTPLDWIIASQVLLQPDYSPEGAAYDLHLAMRMEEHEQKIVKEKTQTTQSTDEFRQHCSQQYARYLSFISEEKEDVYQIPEYSRIQHNNEQFLNTFLSSKPPIASTTSQNPLRQFTKSVSDTNTIDCYPNCIEIAMSSIVENTDLFTLKNINKATLKEKMLSALKESENDSISDVQKKTSQTETDDAKETIDTQFHQLLEKALSSKEAVRKSLVIDLLFFARDTSDSCIDDKITVLLFIINNHKIFQAYEDKMFNNPKEAWLKSQHIILESEEVITDCQQEVQSNITSILQHFNRSDYKTTLDTCLKSLETNPDDQSQIYNILQTLLQIVETAARQPEMANITKNVLDIAAMYVRNKMQGIVNTLTKKIQELEVQLQGEEKEEDGIQLPKLDESSTLQSRLQGLKQQLTNFDEKSLLWAATNRFIQLAKSSDAIQRHKDTINNLRECLGVGVATYVDAATIRTLFNKLPQFDPTGAKRAAFLENVKQMDALLSQSSTAAPHYDRPAIEKEFQIAPPRPPNPSFIATTTGSLHHQKAVHTLKIELGDIQFENIDQPCRSILGICFEKETSPLPPSASIFSDHEIVKRTKLAQQQMVEYNNALANKTAGEVITYHCTLQGTDDEKLQTIQTKCETQLATAKQQAQDLQKELLTAANQGLVTSSPEDILTTMQRSSGQKKTIRFEDIIAAFLKQDASSLKEANPFLTDEHIKKIFNDLGAYLFQRSLMAQLSECLNLIKEYTVVAEECTKANQQPPPVPLGSIGTILARQRYYEIKDYPQMAVFEAFSGNMIREDQVAAIAWAVKQVKEGKRDNDAHLMQAFAGFGKSKLFIPILAPILAQHGYLPVVLNIGTMYTAGKDDLSVSLPDIFSQILEVIEVDIGDTINQTQLDKIATNLQRWKEQGKCLLIKPETWHCLNLQLQNAYISQNGPALKRLFEIISFLKEHAFALHDEAHLLLNSLTEAIRSMDKPTNIPQEEVDLLLKNYAILVGNDPVVQKIGLAKNLQSLATKEEIAAIQKHLIQQTAQIIPLEEGQLQQVQDFLENNEGEFPEWLTTLGRSTTSEEQQLADIIVLQWQFIHTILPHMLQLKGEIDYGQAMDPKDLSASPRHNKQPTSAKFSMEYITLAASIQMVHQMPLTAKEIKEIIKILKPMQEALRRQQIVGPTSVDVLFDGLFPIMDGKQQSHKSLDEICIENEEDIAAITTSLQDSVQTKEFYINTIVAPQIDVFSSQITSTPAELASGFASNLLITATPGCLATYPVNLTRKAQDVHRLDRASEAETIQVMLSTENSKVLTIDQFEDAEDFFEVLYQQDSTIFETLQFTIDGGGICSRKATNIEMVHAYVEYIKKLVDGKKISRSPPSGGICTTGSGGEKKLLFVDSGKKSQAIPEGRPLKEAMKDANLDPELLKLAFYYYSITETTGTDWQMGSSLGAMTVGEGETVANAIQAAKRARGLGKGQRLCWVLTKKLAENIPLQEGKELSAKEILLWMIDNEAEKQEKQLMMRFQQGINSILKQHIMGKIAEQDHPFDDANYERYRGFLQRSSQTRPFERFKKEKSTEIVNLEEKQLELKRRALSEYQQLYPADTEFTHLGTQAREDIDRLIVQTAMLVSKISQKSSTSLSTEAVQQKETEQQTEQQQETLQESMQETTRRFMEAATEKYSQPDDSCKHKDFLTDDMISQKSCEDDYGFMRSEHVLNVTVAVPELIMSTQFTRPAKNGRKENYLRPFNKMLLKYDPQGTPPYRFMALSEAGFCHYKKQLESDEPSDNNASYFLIGTSGDLLAQDKKASQEVWNTIQQSREFKNIINYSTLLNGRVRDIAEVASLVEPWGKENFNALIAAIDKKKLWNGTIDHIGMQEVRKHLGWEVSDKKPFPIAPLPPASPPAAYRRGRRITRIKPGITALPNPVGSKLRIFLRKKFPRLFKPRKQPDLEQKINLAQHVFNEPKGTGFMAKIKKWALKLLFKNKNS